jgi:hypothetical protein
MDKTRLTFRTAASEYFARQDARFDEHADYLVQLVLLSQLQLRRSIQVQEWISIGSVVTINTAELAGTIREKSDGSRLGEPARCLGVLSG